MNRLIVADESVDFAIVEILRKARFAVRAIVEEHPGWPDERVLEFAFRENAFLLTEDKDFGELTYRLKKPNHGILLIRLIHLPGEVKAPLVLEVLRENGDRLLQCLSVLDEGKLRIKPYR
jgi:predicted nuclease of predicted toxin-antitoxin system